MTSNTYTCGASRAQILADGDLPALWMEARDPSLRVDLSDVLAVQMGIALEPLHVAWFTRRTGVPIQDEQMILRNPEMGLHATLDGRVRLTGPLIPWEGKTTGKSTTMQKLVARYHAQLAVQCLMAGATECVLSGLWRELQWRAAIVTPCQSLTAELIERAAILRHHVLAGTEPPRLTAYPVPAPEWRDFTFTQEKAA